ncbi:MAG: hypothetical protein AAF711_10255, partial [Planctomycetota bacterium]
MRHKSYLPTTDSGMLNWSSAFASTAAALPDPAVIGLTAQQVSDYQALQSDYATKYAAAVEPATRGGASILAKNKAKKALTAESRQLAMAVTNHPGITDQQRYDLGLTVRDTEPTPAAVPATVPEVTVRSVEGRLFNLQLK